MQMPRLIWVLAGHTGHFAGFVMLRLKWSKPRKVSYMPYLTLWDKISHNLAHLEAIFKSHRIFRPSKIFIQHILWWNKHKSHFVVFITSFLHLNKGFWLLCGSSKVIFVKISEFYQISLKNWPHHTDFSPQHMACMKYLIFHSLFSERLFLLSYKLLTYIVMKAETKTAVGWLSLTQVNLIGGAKANLWEKPLGHLQAEYCFLHTRPEFLWTQPGLRNVVLHGGVRRLSCKSQHQVLTSFSAKRYDVNVEAEPSISWPNM